MRAGAGVQGARFLAMRTALLEGSLSRSKCMIRVGTIRVPRGSATGLPRVASHQVVHRADLSYVGSPGAEPLSSPSMVERSRRSPQRQCWGVPVDRWYLRKQIDVLAILEPNLERC